MKSIFFGLTAVLLATCAHRSSNPTLDAVVPEEARNVILMVADGAGVAHWSLALLEKEDLAIKQFVYSGLMDTRGSDHIVSGSAPGATALSTGERSFMGAIAVASDSVPIETVLERAMIRGKATGLLTTTAIFDATPAAFAAHSVHRYRFEEITVQMVRKGVNVLMGGGRRFFRTDERRDGTDLMAELRSRYTYVETEDQLRDLDLSQIDRLFGLFAEVDMGPAEGRSPSLSRMTEAALAILGRDPDGFFLLVENEETDSQAHANEPADKLTREMLEFDAAIAVALKYQEDHPETLIVVTSDHETGGISLPHDSLRNVVVNYSTTSHTGALVPIFAKGPGADRFTGILRNDEVGKLLLAAIGTN